MCEFALYFAMEQTTPLLWSAEQSELRRAHAQVGNITVCSFWQDRGGC